jgi:hypothetical protein
MSCSVDRPTTRILPVAGRSPTTRVHPIDVLDGRTALSHGGRNEATQLAAAKLSTTHDDRRGLCGTSLSF